MRDNLAGGQASTVKAAKAGPPEPALGLPPVYVQNVSFSAN